MKEMVLEKPADYKPKPPDYDGHWKKIIGELFEQFTAFFAPKKSHVTSILEKYDTAAEVTIDHLNSLIYFVDILLKPPEEMNHKLREEPNPYLGEEVITKMRAEKTNQPPTIAELMKEYEQEGIEKGKKEAIKDISEAISLIRKNYSNERISEITKLTTDEIEELRKSLQ